MLVKSTFVLLFFAQQSRSAFYKTDGNHNVLFIVVDDLRHLSADNVNLTNIQKLTARGVRFQHAYAQVGTYLNDMWLSILYLPNWHTFQQALCAPSRNSLLTGRRPDSLRLYDFYSYWRDTAGNFTTIPQFFKENGYETYSAGKVFHPGQSSNYTDDYPHSWSHYPYHPQTEIYKDAAVCKDHFTNTLESNLICPVNVKYQPGYTLPDLETLDYAINILKERHYNSKPYFLAVGFHKPHIPLKFPKEFLRKFYPSVSVKEFATLGPVL